MRLFRFAKRLLSFHLKDEFDVELCDGQLPLLHEVRARRLLGPASVIPTPGLDNCHSLYSSDVHLYGSELSYGFCFL